MIGITVSFASNRWFNSHSVNVLFLPVVLMSPQKGTICVIAICGWADAIGRTLHVQGVDMGLTFDVFRPNTKLVIRI